MRHILTAIALLFSFLTPLMAQISTERHLNTQEIVRGTTSPVGVPPSGAKEYFRVDLGQRTHYVGNGGLSWLPYPKGVQKQQALTGGGVVSWQGNVLNWSNRFITIATGRGVDNISTSGYYDISMPPIGTVIQGMGGAPNQTVTAAGVPFVGGASWYVLYYLLPSGGNGSNPANFRIAGYTADFILPDNAVMIGAWNTDDGSLRLGTGVTLAANSTNATNASLLTNTIVLGAGGTAQQGYQYEAIASYQGNGSYQNQVIYTNIPANSLIMPTINLRGYGYGTSDTIDLQIGSYMYNSPTNSIYNAVWQCKGTVCPTSIRAGFDATSKLVLEINWGAAQYFYRYQVTAYNDGNNPHQAAWFKGWSIGSAILAATVTNIVTVGRKSLTPSWGLSNSRTDNRNDAGLQGNVGAISGFYETSAPAPAANWYAGASNWQHLLDVRHSNTVNNYAMQVAGSFFNQDFYGRKTNGNAAQPWVRFITEDANGVSNRTKGVFQAQNVPGAWNGLTGKTILSFTNKPNARYSINYSCSFYSAIVGIYYLRLDNNGAQISSINHYFNAVNQHTQVSAPVIITSGATAINNVLSIKSNGASDANDFCSITAVEL